ncbi:MAG TPA: ABC transporter substrate-binding protein [Burkholderiaceae bacterium]|nr:ABC transporter substrate-binding protein [Burkholderiaceae bacterium]
MKRILLNVLTVATLAAGGVAHAERGVHPNRIVFGMQTDLSGVVANVGVAQANAIRMRFDEANANGGVAGRRLELVVEDSGYQVPRAVQAVNKLIQRDQVFALIASMGAGLNNAVLPDQLAAGVPNLFPNAAAKAMYEPFHKLKFAGYSPYLDQTRAGVAWLAKERGVRKPCVLYIKNDMGDEILEAVQEQSKTLGLTVQSASHRPTDVDFAATVQRMKDGGCDALVLGTLVRDTVGILGAVKAINWSIPIVGGSPTQQPPVAQAPGGVAEGFYAMAQLITAYPDDENKPAAAWVQRYTAKFNGPPNVYAQLAYSWADMVVAALERTGKDVTVDRFVAALEQTKDYQDVFGSPKQSLGPSKRLSMDESLLVQVKNGRWVRGSATLKH